MHQIIKQPPKYIIMSTFFTPSRFNPGIRKIIFFLLAAVVCTAYKSTAQTCVADNATAYVNGSVVIKVRANDTYPSNYLTIPYTFGAAAAPQHGTITILNGDSIQYTPNANYVGQDHFIYGVADPSFPTYAVDTASVTVNITCNLQVAANGDISFCGNIPAQTSLIATAANFSSTCTVSWSPTTYLSNANSFSPVLDLTQVNQHAGPLNTDYIVTVVDSVSGCSATDTMHVFAASAFNETINVCGNQPAILNGHMSGVLQYSWIGGASGNGTLTVNAAGTYYLSETFAGGCALTSVYHVIDSCINMGCQFNVNLGPDINQCGNPPGTTAQLGNTSSMPSGTYSYQWYPSTGLSNPNSPTPTVNNVVNQTYILYVSNGSCTATDTIVVTQLNYQVGTIYNCNGSPVVLSSPPGAYLYQWMFSPAPASTVSTTVVTQPGNYGFAAYYNGCAVTNSITVVDSCQASPGNVWPGDCNYDLIADCYDFLNICMGYGQTGALRPLATTSWYAQPMTDWATAAYGANDKHSDCDGNGIIDINDAQAIVDNYNFTHAYKLSAPAFTYTNNADMYLVADRHTAGLQETVTFDIMLGSSAAPVNDIYAIAYQLTYEDNLELMNTPVVYTPSWFGNTSTNLVRMEVQLQTTGQKDCAVGGNDQQNRTGYGKIGEFKIVTTDNLSGIAVLHADITNLMAIMNDGTQKMLTVSGDTVVINSATGIAAIDAGVQVGVYPNPSNGQITVNTTGADAEMIVVYNMVGETVYSLAKAGAIENLDLSQLAEGIYTLKVKTGKGFVNRKISIKH